MASRLKSSYFSFESVIVVDYFLNGINFSPDGDSSNFDCISSVFNQDTNKLDIYPIDCQEKHTIICRKVLFSKPQCNGTSNFTMYHTFRLMLDPDLRLPNKLEVVRKKVSLKTMFQRLDKPAAFEAIYSSLWYASLPCFDVQTITADMNGGSALLSYCEWKGMPISCSAIFTTFPTDQGMCCSFNMKAADEIFIENTFTQNLQKMQMSDKLLATTPSKIPKWFVDRREPKTSPGKNKGLVVMLDAHSDQLSAGSIDSDFRGFTAFIGSRSNFPLMSQEGVEIRPGYTNEITLTSTKIEADGDMTQLLKNDRHCLFPEENTGLKIHKEYSYLNCKLECILEYTMNEIYAKYNQYCQPWYFPSANNSITICDPWEQYDFFNIMNNKIPSDLCNNCLPDCKKTDYKSKINVLPFDDCDLSNLGISPYCKFINKKVLPMTNKLANQILKDIFAENNSESNLLKYAKNLKSDIRTHGKFLQFGDVFKKNPKTYDPFESDMALVQITYKTPTAFYIGSQSKMSWTDYFSTVGGLLGLVLGMGFVSFVEMLWQCMRILSRLIDLFYNND